MINTPSLAMMDLSIPELRNPQESKTNLPLSQTPKEDIKYICSDEKEALNDL